MTLEETLVSVWRQVLEENANLVQLEERSYPVRRTARRRLRQVDFEFAGEAFRGIEQNPGARSKWAQLAAAGNLYSHEVTTDGATARRASLERASEQRALPREPWGRKLSERAPSRTPYRIAR